MNEQQPEKASTPGLPFPLQDGEQILEICRRHWIYLWPHIALIALAGISVPIVLGLLLDRAGGFEGVGAQIFWLAAAVYVIYWAVRAFLAWYRHHNDIWVITNQRLIDSFKRHPFNMRIATADLVNVQDMTIERNGILRTMLDYGDIVCQTASELQDFRLPGIPNPRTIQALVDKERDRERLRTRS